MARRALDCVLFDVGGTLLRVEPSVGEVYARVARQHGVNAVAESINAGFRGAWKRSLKRSEGRGFRTSDQILRGEWLQIVTETFGGGLSEQHMDALFTDLYDRFSSSDVWLVVPGARETLRFLRQEGVRLGVLSNWDSRLLPLLERLELAGAFDFVVASHAVGFEKPHPAIFERALHLSGTAAGRALHVGDSYFADIEPAARQGLNTLWIESERERGRLGYTGPGAAQFPADPAAFWPALLAGTSPGHPTRG